MPSFLAMGDHFLSEGTFSCIGVRGDGGTGTFCESVTTHYDTFTLSGAKCRGPKASPLDSWLRKKDGGIFPLSFSTKCLFDMEFALYLIGQTRTIFGTVFSILRNFLTF